MNEKVQNLMLTQQTSGQPDEDDYDAIPKKAEAYGAVKSFA